MYCIENKYLLVVIFAIVTGACSGQMKKEPSIEKKRIDRNPAVAGSFYPSDSAGLSSQLAAAFKIAVKTKDTTDVLAIVSPHAGYVYSAKVSASAFNQIDTTKTYDHIFLIGSSHRVHFDGASIYTSGDFITPLGHITTDELGNELSKKSDVFNFKESPHLDEHSLEVQLPFLQHLIHRNFSIIPILLGTHSPKTCKKIAQVLKPYFNERNLFIISTDFSHYPGYTVAKEVDAFMADAVMSNNPQKLIDAVKDIENRNNPDLLTGMCGWTSVLTLMYMSEDLKGISIRNVDSQNSGDIERGDKSRVVGYVALAFEKTAIGIKESQFVLTSKEKKTLLEIAGETIGAYVRYRETPAIDESRLTPNLKKQAAAFVTLHIGGDLRGCIGTFKADRQLYKTVQDMAVSAAVNDTRFESVSIPEINMLQIEISVLTPMRKISSIDEIELGKHGIYIRKGRSSGTLLPQVATDQKWTREQFLGYCARDKAGIGWNGWKDADLFVYEAIVFHE
jgi:MEMO1 family protein